VINLESEIKPIKILIIEDDPDQKKLLKILLERNSSSGATHYVASEASTLAESLSRLDQDCFDAVLMDLNLPDSSQQETVRTLREHSPTIPLVIISGEDERVLAKLTEEVPKTTYFLKDRLLEDFSLPTLMDRLKSLQ